jgi:formate-dependent nitrite reductase membrane component NrfD
MRFVLFIFLGLSAVAAPDPVSAAVFNNLNELVSRVCTIADWIFTYVVIIAILMIVWAAFLHLTSAGDPQKITQANGAIWYAAIGIVVALLSSSIPRVIALFLGASPLGC